MTPQNEAREPFYQFLILQTLRLVARLAIRLRRASLSELKELLGIALFRELRAQGYSIRDMSVALDCTARNVRYLGKRSRDLAHVKGSEGCIRRVIRRLRQGPITMTELQGLMPIADGFDPGRTTVSLLKREKVIEDTLIQGFAGYQLTAAYRSLKERGWSEPLKDFEAHFCLAHILVDLVAEGINTEDTLFEDPRLASHPRHGVVHAIDLLIQMGELEKKEDETYAFTKKSTCLVPADPTARLRMGTETLVERLGWAFDTIIDGKDPSLFGQRTFLFDADPEALTRFIKEHNEFVRQNLIEIDAACENHPQRKRCVATWFIFPKPEDFRQPARSRKSS